MTELPELYGPSQEPASGGPAQQLVILCHGVGSDGQDLIGLAPYLAKVLPDAKFMAPDAPYAFDQAPFGRQWFSLGDMSMENKLLGTQSVAPILDDFIDEQLAAHGLSEHQLALVGFSQGTMVSLHVGLRRTQQLAAIVGFSGILIGPELLSAELKSRPPVMLMHGDADDIVPPENLGLAVSALQGMGISVRHEMRPVLGHGLDDRCILAAMEFLAQSFGVPLPEGGGEFGAGPGMAS
ncbi:MAG: prolyl oligopeptidase family serine peptidase [Rhodospirillaceae bacterium]|jgi:phospholipase/carboxylesterase|nr:prolyl oligopeptidase family serine peptidase [Rhodospirillaceae bacterium]